MMATARSPVLKRKPKPQASNPVSAAVLTVADRQAGKLAAAFTGSLVVLRNGVDHEKLQVALERGDVSGAVNAFPWDLWARTFERMAVPRIQETMRQSGEAVGRKMKVPVRKYDPNQLRAPAGTPAGGQWVAGGSLPVAGNAQRPFRTNEGYGRTEVSSHLNRKLRTGEQLTDYEARVTREMDSAQARATLTSDVEMYRVGHTEEGPVTSFLSVSTWEGAYRPGARHAVIQVPTGTHLALGDWHEAEVILPRRGRLTRVGGDPGRPVFRYSEDRDWHQNLEQMEASRQAEFHRFMEEEYGEDPFAKADFSLSGLFNLMNPRAYRIASEIAARLVTRVTDATRWAIRQVIADAQQRGVSVRNQAQSIRQILVDTAGLDAPRARRLARFQEGLNAREMRPNVVAQRVEAYRDQLITDRARTIARHETQSAAVAGQEELWAQAAEAGLIDSAMRMEWITAPDERTCPICEPMDGQKQPRGTLFVGGDGQTYERPPAHIQCRCTLALVVDDPLEKYDPNQPRDPAGSETGGQWTSDSAKPTKPKKPKKPPKKTTQQDVDDYLANLPSAKENAQFDPNEMVFGGEHAGVVERVAAAKYLDELHKGVALGPEDIEALETYQDGGYQDVNGWLRSGVDPSGKVGNLATLTARMDGVFAQMPPLDREVVAWRGMGNGSLGDGFSPGGGFADDGYVSTSTTPIVASRFAPLREDSNGDFSRTLFRVSVKPGTRALWMSRATGDGSEHELVLNRGTEFRVRAVTTLTGAQFEQKYGASVAIQKYKVRVIELEA